MKHHLILFIGLIIVAIILLILSFILGELFFLFPFIFISPLSCGFRRRLEENSNSNETTENTTIQQNTEDNVKVIANAKQTVIRACPRCNNKISERNLKFCPYCGAKL